MAVDGGSGLRLLNPKEAPNSPNGAPHTPYVPPRDDLEEDRHWGLERTYL
jgi:hypothetical protein